MIYDPIGLKVMITVLIMAMFALFIFLWIARSFFHALIASVTVTAIASAISFALALTVQIK